MEQYFFKSGRIYSGMVVVEYVLADEGPGDGGAAPASAAEVVPVAGVKEREDLDPIVMLGHRVMRQLCVMRS